MLPLRSLRDGLPHGRDLTLPSFAFTFVISTVSSCHAKDENACDLISPIEVEGALRALRHFNPHVNMKFTVI